MLNLLGSFSLCIITVSHLECMHDNNSKSLSSLLLPRGVPVGQETKRGSTVKIKTLYYNFHYI